MGDSVRLKPVQSVDQFLMISGLAILVIGFFLGMRHATDPDHVIAVSTIVSPMTLCGTIARNST